MLKYLIEKEFKQIVRNSFLPRLIIVMPLMIMLVLPWAADQEIKNVKLSVIDNDHSPDSERLIRKLSLRAISFWPMSPIQTSRRCNVSSRVMPMLFSRYPMVLKKIW